MKNVKLTILKVSDDVVSECREEHDAYKLKVSDDVGSDVIRAS